MPPTKTANVVGEPISNIPICETWIIMDPGCLGFKWVWRNIDDIEPQIQNG
jgi:hypothetical protein